MRNVTVLYRCEILGTVVGRSCTISAREADFLNRIIPIALRLQFESR
jgi:hypothetical protein